MKTRFVKWTLIGGLGLAACSTLLVSCSGCGRQAKQGIFVDPGFGPLIPPDTLLMAGVRMDKVRETALYKRLNQQLGLEKRLNLFSQRTGLDPRRDLWQVLFVSNGTRNLVFARGRFTVGEMEPKLGALGSERIPYKDYTLIGNAQTSVVFLNAGVAVAGTRDALKSLLDHRSEYHDMPAVFKQKLALLPAQDQIWAIDNGALQRMQAAGPDTTGMRSMLSNLVGFVKTSSVGVHLDEGADVSAEIDCVSAEGAQRVRDALKGAVGLARLNTRSDQMEMLKLYDAVTVQQKDAHVDVRADLTSDLIDQVVKMLPSVKARAEGALDQLKPQ